MAVLPYGATAAEPAASVISREPSFAGLVRSARTLKTETDRFSAHPALAVRQTAKFAAYARDIRALSAGDLKGHYTLRDRGTDNDLKCILMGVSRDLEIKMTAIEAARTDADLGTAFHNMSDLLSDNVDVIVTPATTDSGLDCVIEFGKGA
ncbi:hypothetical protein [Asticcacaulis solisilvae]|uniref:hypothetical protein n=1 Tax=Asticcacaulis solisilvae TaxID=1217274 RepID=UPI003FD8C3BE